MAPYRIGVISDTHGVLYPEVFKVLAGVDLIVHAGDVGGEEILTELEAIAPVKAVSGNVDWEPDPRRRPLYQTIETPVGRLAMTHGHLPQAPSTDLNMMKDFFSDFDPHVIIYGHSHIAKLEEIGGVKVFNPGSAGPPRFGRKPSVGLMTEAPDGPARLEHVTLEIG